MTDRCPDCGEPLDWYEIGTYETAVTERVTYRTCCEPAPTAAQMARRADDVWLAKQRQLADER